MKDFTETCGALSEPVTECVKAVRAALSVLYEPTRIRQEARAQADAAILKAQTECELADIASRARMRARIQEINQQFNIERVLAEYELLAESADFKSAPSPDWVANFLSGCENVSDDEMQQLWGRILSQECSEPGKFSVRTLEFVRLLSKREAVTFSRFCNVLFSDGEPLFPANKLNDGYLKELGIGYDSLLELETLGLINMNHARWLTEPDIYLQYGDKAYKATLSMKQYNTAKGMYFLNCSFLTKIGQELMDLVKIEPNYDFAEKISADLATIGVSLEFLPNTVIKFNLT